MTNPNMNDLTFIETQFPVSKISKESYKERMANYSQTLTGLGKWWGRKPLVLVRAAILGLLMPASADPEKDREIFLKLMTMDPEGLWRRKVAGEKKISAKDVYRILTDEEHQDRVQARLDGFLNQIPGLTHDLRSSVMEFIKESNGSYRWQRGSHVSDSAKEALERLAFDSLYYDEKLNYTVRPEHLDGPEEHTWKEINAHLNTKATSLPELIEELGRKRFGHRPRVGDAFCGGGSIPFEAARLGCDVYASDLNPVAALLTWAAIHIVGGGPEVAAEVRAAQEKIYDAVDQQIREWGIEHNESGHRADAYLYCVEVLDPDSGWMVPLAPSWVIGEKTRTVAILIPDQASKRYEIQIKMDASDAEMKAAKKGTVQDGYVVHPMNPNPVSMSLIRRENQGGLRLWENEDVVPRPDDVFQERLYCIRCVESKYFVFTGGDWQEQSEEEYAAWPGIQDLEKKKKAKIETRRYYAAPTAFDLKNEEKTLHLLKERFSEWQEKGYIPSRRIEEGPKTSEPIRTRGWTHWHHLFNPRQLLVNGLLGQQCVTPISVVALGKTVDWNNRLCVWDSSYGREEGKNVFLNQALNTNFNYSCRPLPRVHTYFVFGRILNSYSVQSDSLITVGAIENVTVGRDLWITDPPYADAVNYHELSEFFLAWFDKALKSSYPDWYTDSKRALAIKGSEGEFKRSMVNAYSNLCKHMPDNGLQIVMFTHQDASVWADLALILWASGLRVTAAWTIATETTSALKEGNYVQGTVLLVLRKNTNDAVAFLDELIPQIDAEVRSQVDSMMKIEDKEEPNFNDTDYQLAAYAAALRVLTGYSKLEDIDVERELNEERPSGQVSPLAEIIENAKGIASSYLIPPGITPTLWRDLSGPERYYLKGLDMQAKGENKAGVFQELARGFGVADYSELMESLQANHSKVKTATGFGDRQMGGPGFESSLLRKILYSVAAAVDSGVAARGLSVLKSEYTDYARNRAMVAGLLRYLSRFGHTLREWKQDSEMAELLAGLVENDMG